MLKFVEPFRAHLEEVLELLHLNLGGLLLLGKRRTGFLVMFNLGRIEPQLFGLRVTGERPRKFLHRKSALGGTYPAADLGEGGYNDLVMLKRQGEPAVLIASAAGFCRASAPSCSLSRGKTVDMSLSMNDMVLSRAQLDVLSPCGEAACSKANICGAPSPGIARSKAAYPVHARSHAASNEP